MAEWENHLNERPDWTVQTGEIQVGVPNRKDEWKQIFVHYVWGMQEPRTLPGLGPGESQSWQARLLESSTSTGQVNWKDTVPVSLWVLGQKKKKVRK